MLFYVLFAVCVLPCMSNILQPYNETAKQMFHDYDANGNGIFELVEMEYTFFIYDVDRSGDVSHAEYTNFFKKFEPQLVSLAGELFKDYDVDNDNKLELHDYDYFYKILDSDGDGDVSEQEFTHYWTIKLESLGHLIDAGGVSI